MTSARVHQNGTLYVVFLSKLSKEGALPCDKLLIKTLPYECLNLKDFSDCDIYLDLHDLVHYKC